MKLRNLVAVAALGLVASCGTPTQVTDTTTVYVAPVHVRTAFSTQYPTASRIVWSTYDPVVVTPIDWELSGWDALDANDYVVTFDINGEPYYAWYDEDGNWIGTAYIIRDYTTVPSVVTNVAYNKFPGYSISSINKEIHKDRMAYEVELKNSDTKVKLLVDSDGNILKQKTKSLY